MKRPPPTETISPPAKRTQKAAKRRCEVELLRETDSEEELQLTPVDRTRQAPLIDSPPSLVLLSTPAPVLSPAATSVGLLPAPPSPISAPATSLLSAGSPVGQPPSPHSPTSSPTLPTPHTLLAQPVMPADPPDSASPTRAPAGLPPPPPWTDAFSNDPDRILCWKCCKRSYIFRWYSHCYMCHLNESKS
jgi:hypothetical protein